MIEKSFKMTRVFEFLCVLSCRGTSKNGSNITATPEMNSLFLRQYTHMYIHTYMYMVDQRYKDEHPVTPAFLACYVANVWRDEGADALIGKSPQFKQFKLFHDNFYF